MAGGGHGEAGGADALVPEGGSIVASSPAAADQPGHGGGRGQGDDDNEEGSGEGGDGVARLRPDDVDEDGVQLEENGAADGQGEQRSLEAQARTAGGDHRHGAKARGGAADGR